MRVILSRIAFLWSVHKDCYIYNCDSEIKQMEITQWALLEQQLNIFLVKIKILHLRWVQIVFTLFFQIYPYSFFSTTVGVMRKTLSANLPPQTGR